MFNLYDLKSQTENYKKLMNLIQDTEAGDLEFDFSPLILQIVENLTPENIDDFVALSRTLKAQIEALKAEKAYFANREKQLTTIADALTENLKAKLELADVDNKGIKLKGEKFFISLSKGSLNKVEINEELLNLDELPDNCKKVKVEPLKTPLKELLKSGGFVKGVTLAISRTLRIG